MISIEPLFAQRYTYRKYSIKDGLPASECTSVFSDSRGYLWVSTNGGLSRFDGKTFKNFMMSDGLPQYFGTYNFVEDALHRIWFHFKDQVCCFDGTHFLQFPIQNPPKDIWIVQVLETSSHKMRFVSCDGIYELQHGKWIKINILAAKHQRAYRYFTEINDNLSLISSYDSILLINKKGNYSTIMRTDKENSYLSLIKLKSGQIFVRSLNHIYAFNNNQLNLIHDEVIGYKNIQGVFGDHENNLWVGTIDNGIYIFNGNHYEHIEIKGNNYIYCFTEDYEGNVWAISFTGLIKIYKSGIEFFYSNPVDFEKRQVRSIFKDAKGNIFLGHTTGGYSVYTKNAFTSSDNILDINSKNKVNSWILSFTKDEKDRLWITNNSSRLIRVSGKTAEDMSAKYNVYTGYNPVIYNPFDKSIYTATNTGIARITDEKISFEPISDFEGDFFTTFSIDSSGAVWGGTTNGAIYCRNHMGIKRFNEDLAIKNTGIRKIHWKTANELWIATKSDGLIKFKKNKFGKFIKEFVISSDDGLQSDMVIDFAFDSFNNVWATTAGGLAHIQFRNNTLHAVTKFGEKEGFDNISYLNSCLTTDNEGNIWYGTDEHLSCIYPNEIKDDTISPIVHIESAYLFSSKTNWNQYSDSIDPYFQLPLNPILPYFQNTITLEFNAITFGNPNNIVYSYKCLGLDTSWTNSGHVNRISFSNLKAGRYTIMVRAKKPNSDWSAHPAIFSFSILPPYWETWWFRGLIILLISSIIYGLYRFRMNHVLKLQKIRNKIASDLHDDIGSTLNSISIYSEVAKQSPEKDKFALEMIGESSRNIIDSLSDIVWSINPVNDQFENIIERMRSHAYNILRAKRIEYSFRTDEKLNLLRLSMEHRRNFYLIFKEALNNIVKYSNASKVALILVYEEGYIKLSIRDNGKGFDTNVQSNGNGLNNMKRRASEIGASIIIDSEIGNGTAINLKLKR